MNKTKETNEKLPDGVRLKTLEFDGGDSRLIWDHEHWTPQGHRMRVNACATYVCGVLSGLELNFWMTIREEGGGVPYNITHTYAGAADELHVMEADLGRFSQIQNSGGCTLRLPLPDQYRVLKEEEGFYPILFPGGGGESMAVLVPRTRRPVCGWIFDENHGFYNTHCGNAYVFEHELKLGDSHKFCSGCGRLIKIVPSGKTFSEKWSGAFELPPADSEDARLTHLLQEDEENVLANDEARLKPEVQTEKSNPRHTMSQNDQANSLPQMFRDVVTMNEAFGNPKGRPEEITQPRFHSQCKNIADEVAELQLAIDAENLTQIRDGLSDIMVFTLGAFHFLGIDADVDMAAVFKSNMSKFCKDERELFATKAKYDAIGVKYYEEGEYPTKCLKCLEDFIDAAGNAYRKGKFLKGIAYKEPVLIDVQTEVVA